MRSPALYCSPFFGDVGRTIVNACNSSLRTADMIDKGLDDVRLREATLVECCHN